MTDNRDEASARPSGGHVEWRDWDQAAFDAAAESERPVLLSLVATWSAECHRMDEETYGEPRIAAAIDDGFVPVRADVDRQPRVAARYSMGGVPSTVFLTPEGEILTGAGPLGPAGMRQAIEGVRRTWTERGRDAGRVPRSVADQEPPAGDVDETIEAHMLEAVRENYDERAGGWGSGAKFPLPRTVEFALTRDREMAIRTLEAIESNLLDDHEGGFYRSAAGSDWSDVQYEKLLDTNAALVRTFANAYRYTGEERYATPAERTVEYLTTTLWTEGGPGDGAFAASQAAGEGVEYYVLEPTERETEPAPPVDGTVLADWNAVAVDALLTLSGLTDDEQAAGFARRALRTLTTAYVEDGQVAHVRADGSRAASERDGTDVPDGTDEAGERGLLLDHARVVRALLSARSVLGAEPEIGTDPVALATTLADDAIERLRPRRAFVDGPASGPGLLDRPLRPLDANVEFADALLDLAEVTGTERYRTVASEVTAAFAGAHRRYGPQAAAFASLASRLTRGPVRIDVTAPAGSDLHRAALRVADHEVVVVPDALERSAAYEPDGAYVVTDEGTSDRAATPEAVGERFAEQL